MHDIIFGMCVCVDVDSALTAEHYDIPRTITCFARHQVIKAGTSFQSHVAPTEPPKDPAALHVFGDNTIGFVEPCCMITKIQLVS